MLGAALLIVLIGVVDDIWDLDWFTKLAGQIIAAGLLAWQGVQIGWLPIGGSRRSSRRTCRCMLTIFVDRSRDERGQLHRRPRRAGRGGRDSSRTACSSSTRYMLDGPTDQTEYFNLARSSPPS